ncbi:MAG TPA: thioesterase [bacterium]|nr:thioesterase [bacterium]HOY45916.1 thioesterase [bacterium]HPG83244.1 thioesterase [bacterium]HPM59532.1 thioesterase [bacterium]
MYSKEYSMRIFETNPDGRLGLVALLDYLQDIASEHAVQLGFGRDDLMKDNRMWVLSRLYAEIIEWPVWPAVLTIQTWHRGTEKLFSFRDYRVSGADGRPLAAATTSWLTIDQTTRRIQRPDENLLRGSSGGFDNALPRSAAKLEPVAESAILSPLFRVRFSDLDVNLHTNNVHYLQWALDSYDPEFLMGHHPRSVEINFLAESRCGEEIVIRTAPAGEEGAFGHAILRPADAAELCRLRIVWDRK